jgi:hypothetical protein
MPLLTPNPSPAALLAHRAACERGDAGYIDPDTRLFVMTSVFLAARGNCCGNGCRHCPWPASEQARAGRRNVPAWPFRRPSE